MKIEGRLTTPSFRRRPESRGAGAGFHYRHLVRNSLQRPLVVFPRRACPVPRYGAGIHVPDPWIPAQGRNDGGKGTTISIPLCGLRKAIVILNDPTNVILNNPNVILNGVKNLAGGVSVSESAR